MKWIEVIQIRLTANDEDRLLNELRKLIDEVNNNTDDILKIYNRVELDNDIRIHLSHHSSEVESNGSTLGLRLASSLKEFGLVNHRIFVEIS